MSKEKFEQMKEKESTEAIQWDIHEKINNTPLSFEMQLPTDLLGIEPIKAKEIVSGLSTILAEREVLKNAYLDVIELDINTENLPIFKELRLKIRDNRTKGIEKWHTTNKAFYLAGGRFVDSIKNKEVVENEQMEAKLMEAEKFFENQEKEKAKVLNDSRIEKIKPYVENAEQMDFKEFSEEDFDDFVFGKKAKHEQRIEAEKLEAERVENERIAKEKEIEATRLENIELKRIADEKELIRKNRNEELRPYVVFIRDYNGMLEMKEDEYKKLFSEIKIGANQQWKFEAEELAKKQLSENNARLKNEKEKAENDAKLKIANDARLKLEKELQDKKDAELKAENERKEKELADQKEAEKLAKSPIKEQLNVWVDSFEMALAPISNATSIEILEKFEAFKKWAKSEIEKI